MPALDRRITVRRSISTFNQYGEVEKTSTDFRMWATRMDASVIDAEMAGGSLNTATRTYRIRWRGDLADATASELAVIEDDETLNILNVMEQSGQRAERRRFLDIEASGEVG